VSELERSIAHFRQQRRNRERQANLALQHAFLTARNALQAQLDGMVAWMDANPNPPLWRVLAEARTRNLLQQADAAFTHYSREVGQTVIHEQEQTVIQAQADARHLIESSFGRPPVGVGLPFVALPQQAVSELVGTLQPTAPVRKLLDTFGPEAAQVVEDELIAGVAMGRNPRATARAISDGLGGHYDRALLISRTETLRAYRNAQQEVYKANSHLLNGWIWHASLSTRTCPACWAMHGTHHPVTETMSEHPAGRCSMIPDTKSWKELGYDVPDNQPTIEPGVDVFNRLSAAEQQQILSPSAYKAFKAGEIELPDLVNVRTSKTWGETRSVGSVEGAKQRAAARQTVPVVQPTPSARLDIAEIERTFFRPDFHAAARESWQEWAKTATQDEIDALTYYKSAGYTNINQYLRDGTKRTFYYGPDFTPTTADELVPFMDSALSRAKLPTDAQVKRGMRLSPDEAKRWAALRPGSVIEDKGFVSTTYDEDVFNQFAGHGEGGVHVTIYAPKGANGLYIDEISDRVASQEAEILFPRDTSFLVRDARRVVDPLTGEETGVIEVVLEVLP
jgi:SPP1 gp7 family putative phage head morphogenesis protein